MILQLFVDVDVVEELILQPVILIVDFFVAVAGHFSYGSPFLANFIENDKCSANVFFLLDGVPQPLEHGQFLFQISALLIGHLLAPFFFTCFEKGNGFFE